MKITKKCITSLALINISHIRVTEGRRDHTDFNLIQGKCIQYLSQEESLLLFDQMQSKHINFEDHGMQGRLYPKQGLHLIKE